MIREQYGPTNTELFSFLKDSGFIKKVYLMKKVNKHIQCVYIVSAKYQIAPSKAVVGLDLPIKALSMHIQKPYKGIIV